MHGGKCSSVLQMHPIVKVCFDEMADYYCWVCENKPDWQTY